MLARHQPRASCAAQQAQRPPSLARARTAAVVEASRDPSAARPAAARPAASPRPAHARTPALAIRATASRDPFAAPSTPATTRPAEPSPSSPQQPQPPSLDPAVTALPAAMRPFGRKTWVWRGHRTSYVTAGCGQVPVVLCHGFGASATQWRRVFQALVDHGGFKVYAPDLLGFGASDMPLPQDASEDAGPHFYRLELWRDQLADFCREFCGGSGSDDTTTTPGPILIGNSVGSLACLMAAAGPVKNASGVVLLNTAGALNNKGVVSDWRIVLAYPIFLLVDFLLSIRPVARALFDNVRDPKTLAGVLKGAYGDAEGGAAVDDELVSLISGPATRDNALDVFVDVVTSPHHGPKPWDLVPELQKRGTPLLVAWGTDDRLTPVDGPVGRYFRALGEEAGDNGITFTLLEGHGHCPHDDPRPTLARDHLLPWLEAVRRKQAGAGAAEAAEEKATATATTA